MYLFLTFFLLFPSNTKTPPNPSLLQKPQNVKVLKYEGVSPPKPVLPKKIPAPGGKCVLVWPGFQLRPSPGGSRFFFLFTSPFSLQSHYLQEKSTTVLRLSAAGCSAWEKHAWRDLITQYFDTPIEKVSFFKDSKTSKLIIDFLYKKNSSSLKPEISHIEFLKYYLLIIDFPKEKVEEK